MFVSRELCFEVEGFPAVALMEDVALSKRLLRHGKPLCLVGPAQTSARRWHQHGICKTIALMWFLRSAYALGASSTWLKRWYADHAYHYE